MLHILGILTNHIATSQLDTIKSQVTGDYIIRKNTKKNKIYAEIGSYYTPTVNISNFLDSIFKFRYWPARFNLLQIKDTRKCTKLVP